MTLEGGAASRKQRRLSALPEWLPPSMRHTASPVERLSSLLSSMLTLAEANENRLLALRAWKVQRLCEKIDREVTRWTALPPSSRDEALYVLRTAREFLRSAEIVANPPVGLILAIHVSAGPLAASAAPDPSCESDALPTLQDCTRE